MTVIQEGAVNTSALIVPDIYVQILSPRHSLLNGVPTNILGIIGTSSWGPKNSPVTISSAAEVPSAIQDSGFSCPFRHDR